MPGKLTKALEVRLSVFSAVKVNSSTERQRDECYLTTLNRSGNQRPVLVFALLFACVSHNLYAADPVAVADTFNTGSGQAVTGSLSSNDLNLDGPADTYSLDTAPANGIATVNTDSSFTYTPNTGYAGSDTFSYLIEDGAGGISTATVAVEIAAASTFISADSNFIVGTEDTSIPLGLSVAADLFSGGALQDLISSDNQFRPVNGGGTPIVSTIPSNATSITITGFSTQSINTAGADDTDDDYQLLNARIDLVTGTSSGQVAFLNDGKLNLLDQYSWESVPLGASVLSDPSKVIGHYTGASNPTFALSANNLQITETHTLETAYIIEYMTSNGDSTNFIQAGNTVQTAGESVSSLAIPTSLQPAAGKHGVVVVNSLSAAAGSNFAVEHKGFSRLVIDLDTMLISGSVAAQQGESENNTVTYSFRDYPLIDQRSNASMPVSILSSSASRIGDTTAKASVLDDVTVYININGELTIERAAGFAAVFTSMYTTEFYARTGFSSIASFVSVSSDDALFDAQPADNVDSNGKPVNELRFNVPASAQVGILHVSWNTIGGTDTNENIGMGFAVVDVTKGVSSGSTTFIRASTPDLVSWDAVPFGSTFFGTMDSTGNPLYQSNKSAGSFTDGYGQTAQFTLINNADGSRELVFTATSAGGTQNFRDYQGNGHISWLGNEPFSIEGIPVEGSLSAGSPLPNGDWEIDFSDMPTLEYIPVEHFSGRVPMTFALSSTGESLALEINIEPAVDGIELGMSPHSGYVNTALSIPVSITASPDTDGSEPSIATYQLDNIPATVTLTSGSGTVNDTGGGTWQADAAALASLTATGTSPVSSTITVSALQIDQFDIDGDSSIEDTNNGAGVDEFDEQPLSESFNLVLNALPTVDSLLVNNGEPTITGSAKVGADETLTVVVNAITYTAGDGNLTVNGDATWVLTIPAGDTLPESTYSITATLSHSGGASASDISTDELIVDLTPPPAPGVTSQTTTDTTPLISGTTVSSIGTTLIVSVNGVLYSEGDGNLTDNGDGTWDLSIPPADAMADGLYQVTATLTDAAGNSASDPGVDELLIDTAAPATPGVTSLVINTGTPVVEGTAVVSAGEILTVTINAVTYTSGDGNLTNNGDGTWNLQIPVANSLPEASYDVTAVVTDIAGNASTDPSSGELVVDLTAPVAPTVDTSLVNIATPTITGGASIAAAETLTVTVNGISYTAGDGSLTDNADGTWSLLIPAGDALAEGVYGVDAIVSDSAGNSTTDTTSNELTVDLTAPAVPTVVSQITNNTNPTLAGTATLTATDTLTVTVASTTYTTPELVINGGNWSLSIPSGDGLTEQTYSVTATVTDAAGNSSDDITGSELIVDLTPPPAPGVTSQTTMNQTPLLSGTLPINSGLLLTVEVYGIVYTAGDGNLVDNADGTWDLQIPATNTLPDALYQVSATLTDAAGNVSTDPGIDELLVDTTAPLAPGVTSLTINTSTPVIEGVATLVSGDVLTVEVNGITYTDGDGSLSADTVSGTWALTIPALNTLPEALYSVTATITDMALNTSADPSSDELLIDLTAPAVPTVTSQQTNKPAPVITGAATVLAGELLSVTVNGITYDAGDGNLVDHTNGTWSLTIPTADALPEGTLDVTATVSDDAGNSVTDLTTDELILDFTAPAVPDVQTLLTNNATPAITGNAILASGDTLSVEVNGITYADGNSNLVANADDTWTLTIPVADTLAENTYEVVATVTDSVGNAAADITSNELIVDLTPPPAPGVTSQTTTNPIPVISGTTTIGTGILLQITVNGVTYTDGDGNLANNGDGTWDLAIPATNSLPDALYQVIATLTDAAGNVSTDPGIDELLVDTTAPPSPGVTSITTNITTPVIEGTAIVNAGDTLTVTVNGITYTAGDGNLVDNADGTWALAIPAANALVENTYAVTATVTDIAGNASTDPSTDELLIDTTAPVAPTADSLITNNTSPTLTGTAIVGNGETLSVTVNGVTYTAGDGNLVDNNDGTWTLTIPATDALSESMLDVSVVVTDAAGNSAADASTSELTIDLTPPAVPTVVSLLTNNINPVISGTAELLAGDTLSVTVDGISYTAGDGNLVDNNDGTWTLTIPTAHALSENTFEVVATITDMAANNADDITSNELIVDLTPPPAPGVTSQTTNNPTPVINGTTAIGTGILLQVSVNGVSYSASDGNLVDNGDGTWDLTIPALNTLPDALYQVVATLTDAAGNTSTDPGSNELLVDTTAPPSPGVTSLTTNLTTPVVEGTAIVNAGEMLTVTVNGITYTAGDGHLEDHADGTWSLTIPAANALPESTYEVTATVTDIAGNTSTDPSIDELLVDTTAPVSPTADSLVTNNTAPTISGTATVGTGEVLTVAVDGVSYTAGDGNLVDNTNGTWTLSIPAVNALIENIFDVFVIVTDAAGNSGTDISTGELTIDLTVPVAPIIEIMADSNNDGLVSSAEPAGDIDLLVTLPAGAAAGDTLEATDGSTILSTVLAATDISTGSVSYTLPAATDGVILNVDATLTDIAGNTSTAGTDSAQFDFSAPSSPQVVISEDTNDDALINIAENTANDASTVDIAIFLPLDVNAGDTLDWSVNGSTNTLTLSGVHVVAGVVNVTTANLFVDTDNINVSAQLTDAAGNASVSGADSAVYDLTSPQTATVVSQITNNVTPVIEGTATVSPGDTLQVTLNSVTYTAGDGNLVNNLDGTWTLTIPPTSGLSETSFDVTVTITDNAGNSSTDTSASELTIDITLPAVPIVDTLVTNNTTPAITGDAVLAAGDLLTVEIDAVTYTNGDGNLTTGPSDTWTLTIPAADALTEAVYEITAIITDAASNSSTDITNSELTVDLTAPPIPTVTSLLTNYITPVLSGNATLSTGDSLTITINGITYTAGDGNLIDNTDGTWTLTIPTAHALTENTFEVVATITDMAANNADDITSNELIVDLTPPPAPGVTSQTTNNPTPVINGTTAIGTGILLQVSVNGVSYSTGDGNLVDNGDGTWNLTIPALNTLSDALYQVVATLTDAAGNTSTDPGSNELLVDTTAPPSPGVTSLTTNLTAPVVEGTAIVNAGETLTVTVNGITYTTGDGNLEDHADGTWSLTIPAANALPENTYEVTATVTDIAGNTSTDPSIDELLVDTTAPVPPTADSLVTNNTAPTISGTATVGTGEVLTVAVDGVSYTAGDGNLVDNTNGTWTLAIPATNELVENSFDVTVTVTDLAGNSSLDITADELTIDLTAPSLPAAQSLITNITTPSISGTATLLPGEVLSVSVNGITYIVGDGNLNDNGDGTWTLTLPATDALVENNYDVTATIVDPAGNNSTDVTSLELTVDLTAPTAPTVTPLVTNTITPVMNGLAVLSTGDSLTVLLNGVSYTVGDGNLVDNADGTWTLSIPTANALIENIYEVQAIVTDDAGNASVDTSTDELTVDLTLPTAPTVTQLFTNVISPILMGTAATTPGDTLTVTVNGITYTAGDGNLEDHPGGTWSLTIPAANALPESTYEVTATVTDIAGNTITDPSIVELLVDTTAPVSPTADSLLTNNTSPTISGTATVGSSEVLTVAVDGVTYTAGDGNLVDNNDGTWSLAIPAANALIENIFDVIVTVADIAGNTSADVTTSELTIDLTPPLVPEVISLVTNNVNPTINGTATLIAGDSLSVTVDGISYNTGDGNLIDNTDGTWSLTIPLTNALVENNYDVTAKVTDLAGNGSIDITTAELTVDLTPPSTPAVTSLIANNVTPTVNGSATVGNHDTLTVTVNGVTYTADDGNLVDNNDGTWTLTIPATDALSESMLDISVVVTDAAGNSAADVSTSELTIDLTPPTVPTVVSLLTNNVTPVINGTAALVSGDTLSVTVDGISYIAGDGNLVDNNDGTWTLTIPTASALTENTFEVTATVTDIAGNTSIDPGIDELLVDTTAPVSPTADSLVTNNTAPTISGTATVGTGEVLTVAVDGVTYTAGDGNLVDNTNGTWTLAIPAVNALIENIFDVSVIVTDAAGNMSPDNSTLELTVDLTPPPAPGVTSMGNQFGTPVISGSWPSTPDTVLTVTVNGITYTEADGNLSVNADGTWSLAIPIANALPDGLYEVVATLSDQAGNQSVDPGVDELLIDTIAPIPPGVTSLTTNSGEPLLNGTAIVEPGDLLTVLVNGVLYTSDDNLLAVATDNTWSLQVPSQHTMAEGQYNVTAVVSDAVGNSSTDPSSGELLIDMTAPNIATVVSQQTNVTTPVLTGLASPGPGEILTVSINGVTYTAGDGVLIDNGDGTWQLGLPQPLTDGSYDIIVSVADAAGNSTDSIGTLLIDTMEPALDVDAVADDKTVTPPLTGSTDQPDGSIVSVTNADGETVCTAVAQNSTWQCEPDTPLAYGSNSLLASVTDAAGNVAQFSFDVAVDTDFDGDGIDNSDEGTGDHDGDGIADLYDLDTDNDGIPDAVEENKDTDNDGIPNYRDRDSDNDGIADVVEAGASDQDLNFILDTQADTDANGLADFAQSTPLPTTDSDFDGIANYLDVDSDQDGIPDLVELGGTDADNDGRIDNALDANSDGIDDAALLLPFAIQYSDNDNIADYLDTDSDQDGTFDLVEAGGRDHDNDGIVDSMLDIDQDGIPDSVDVTYTQGDDTDNDGIDDRMDASQLALLNDVTATTATSTFANDTSNNPFDDATASIDTDGDGIADQFDPDANGDGYADDAIVSLALGMALPDTDGDGTPDFQQAGNPVIYTGLQGHAGCSVTGRASGDPMLALLLMLAFAGAIRRQVKTV